VIKEAFELTALMEIPPNVGMTKTKEASVLQQFFFYHLKTKKI
jgi:hypothetical protein